MMTYLRAFVTYVSVVVLTYSLLWLVGHLEHARETANGGVCIYLLWRHYQGAA